VDRLLGRHHLIGTVHGVGLRVAIVHPYAWPDVRRGGERYLDDLARHVAGAGHHVEMITGTAGPSSVIELDAGGGRLVHRRLRQPRSSRLERRGIRPVETYGLVVAPTLARHRYDVVHALTPTAAIAARVARQPTVFSLIGHPELAELAAHPWLARGARAAVRLATEITALSPQSSAAWADVFGRTAVVLPPGVRLDRFPPALAPRTGPPKVLFSADASDRRKGIDRLLAAFPAVLDRRPDARLQISSATDWTWALGALGPDRDRVAAAVDALGAGRPEDVPGRYREATVTVLPSRGEAFGLVLVESLASGTPVVCNDDGGMPSIVCDPAIGLVADAADPLALAAAILATIELAADPGTPARCVAHAGQWDWATAVSPAHVAVYERVAARPSGARQVKRGDAR
jgi:glycosyltransferase involved in cell wall biosynthesis